MRFTKSKCSVQIAAGDLNHDIIIRDVGLLKIRFGGAFLVSSDHSIGPQWE